ncbi:MAG: sensor domain-containing diguanylate cyclase [Acidobacteriia bacterium]|nr:sensor domain-containing diguanylate cyclase [Terriglobia bacterium]
MATQALGYWLLGTGATGMGLSGFIVILYNLLALACTWAAFRRAEGTAALFWLLFAATLLILLIPEVLLLVGTLFRRALVSESTWRVLWCLYGAPILMMLFLPDVHRRARLKTEIFLDLFQVALVIALSYSTFFYFPLQQMLPPEALLRNLSVSNLLSIFLLVSIFVRLRFTAAPPTRSLLHRLGTFVLVCATVTFIGNWIDLHHYTSASAWFDLGWDLPLIAASFVALTWKPESEMQPLRPPVSFLTFLGTNLFLVAVLSCISLLMDHWKAVYGDMLANAAVIATLVAFTWRLALTQYHQQQEISQREAAQQELFSANETIGGLLEESRAHAQAIAQISELGSLLQACASREEAFRIIPERLRRLFPGTSGAVSLLSASRNRVESHAEWGPCAPADQIFAPSDCWALRRGCAHVHPGGESQLRCHSLCAEGASVCLPLIANGEALGVLAIQENEFIARDASAADPSPAWRPLAAAAAEHIALALSNLNLREVLRIQAVRDPLTGLYNRRYMQEFLEGELQRSRRQRRPLCLLMLDLDRFKRFNDRFGHAAGDDILRALGDTLLHGIRPDDVACRLGGEEFVIVLPECALVQAKSRAEEICRRIKRTSTLRHGEESDPVTVSIGVAAYDANGASTVPLLLKSADEAMYQAKRDGGDRVAVAQSLTASAPA